MYVCFDCVCVRARACVWTLILILNQVVNFKYILNNRNVLNCIKHERQSLT